MITAPELRIGNIIGIVEGSGIKRDGTWRYVNHRVISDIASGNGKDYEPIPLTKEWLLKFGFRAYEEERGHFALGFFHWYKSTGKIQIEFDSVISGSYDYETECRYVHQIQNLYFAMIGEELTIKQ